MPERVTLYHRGFNIRQLEKTLNDYGASRGRHYRVDNWPDDDLDLEEGVPVLGVYQETIDEEIHHIGQDTIQQAFSAFNLNQLEEELLES